RAKVKIVSRRTGIRSRAAARPDEQQSSRRQENRQAGRNECRGRPRRTFPPDSGRTWNGNLRIRSAADHRHISAFGYLDSYRVLLTGIRIILAEPLPKPPGLGSHDGIALGTVVRLSPEDFHADHGLLQFVIETLQMPLDQESQKAR